MACAEIYNGAGRPGSGTITADLGGPLVAGTVDIAFPGMTADTIIFLTAQNGTLNLGALGVSARVFGVGFTVLSSNPLDTRRFAWMAIEP